MKDPYLILGLLAEKELLNDQHVKSAYLRLVQQYPPDRYPEDFQSIRAAYEQLADYKKRLAYELFDTTLPDREDLITALLPENTDSNSDGKMMQRPNLATIQGILKERK